MPGTRRLRLVLVVASAGGLLSGPPALLHAQETATIYAVLRVSDSQLADMPAMVTFLRDGAVVFQGETVLTKSPSTVSVGAQSQPFGQYDVRVEGEGFVTEMKRGVQLASRQNLTLQFILRPGEGAHVVEFAEGGLAREEVAQRLGALEAEVAQLRGATP
ncbi:MAG TPA: hypothetical protein VJ982_14220 [Gemmatimonadota bacterium]|nr:hypothetical protein [Gemmatimonadota bacterium]